MIQLPAILGPLEDVLLEPVGDRAIVADVEVLGQLGQDAQNLGLDLFFEIVAGFELQQESIEDVEPDKNSQSCSWNYA